MVYRANVLVRRWLLVGSLLSGGLSGNSTVFEKCLTDAQRSRCSGGGKGSPGGLQSEPKYAVHSDLVMRNNLELRNQHKSSDVGYDEVDPTSGGCVGRLTSRHRIFLVSCEQKANVKQVSLLDLLLLESPLLLKGMLLLHVSSLLSLQRQLLLVELL